MLILMFSVVLTTSFTNAFWYRTTAINPITGTLESAWEWKNYTNEITIYSLPEQTVNKCRLFCDGIPKPIPHCPQSCRNHESPTCQVACLGIPSNCKRVCYDDKTNCKNQCRGDQCLRTCSKITTHDNCEVVCTDVGGCRRICKDGITICRNVCNNLANCLICDKRTTANPTVTTELTSRRKCINVCDIFRRCTRHCGCTTLCDASGYCERKCQTGFRDECNVFCNSSSGSCLLECGSPTPRVKVVCYLSTCPRRPCPWYCDETNAGAATTKPTTTLSTPTTTSKCIRICNDFGYCNQYCGGGPPLPKPTNCQITCQDNHCIETCGVAKKDCRVECDGNPSSVPSGECQTTCTDGVSSYRCGQVCYGRSLLKNGCQPRCAVSSDHQCSTKCTHNCHLVCSSHQSTKLPITATPVKSDVRTCVDHADHGRCAFYECVDKRWWCDGRDIIQRIALPFCWREDASLTRLDMKARVYLNRTRVCRMRRLMPTYVTGRASCTSISNEADSLLFGDPDGVNCYWMTGSFCDVIKSRANVAVLYDMYSGPRNTERRFLDLFWTLAQRCDRSTMDVFYQSYVTRYRAQYGGVTTRPSESTTVQPSFTIDLACKQLALAGHCGFYSCYDRRDICSGQRDVIGDVGRRFCERTWSFINYFDAKGQSFMEAVQRCHMVQISTLVTSAGRTCRGRNTAAEEYFFSPYPHYETHCLWQNGAWCEVMGVGRNVEGLVRVYGVGSTGDATKRLVSNLMNTYSSQFSPYPHYETHCLWQSGLWCEVMGVGRNVEGWTRVHAVGSSGNATKRLVE